MATPAAFPNAHGELHEEIEVRANAHVETLDERHKLTTLLQGYHVYNFLLFIPRKTR